MSRRDKRLGIENTQKRPRSTKINQVTMDKKLKEIREACIKANSELDVSYMGDEFEKIIHLADVVLVVDEEYKKGEWNEEQWQRAKLKLLFHWKLKDDNLDNQSPETIDFIHNLLTK